MNHILIPATDAPPSVPIYFVRPADMEATEAKPLPEALAKLSPASIAFLRASGFAAKPGQHLLIPSKDGALECVAFGIENVDAPHRDPFRPGLLPNVLPAGTYRFANTPHDLRLATLAFALGSYKFTRYRKSQAETDRAQFVVPDGIDADEILRTMQAAFLARDLINTPANDMGPDELEASARVLATAHRAALSCISGDALLAANLPLIHAVGKASTRAPRLIDMQWGDASHPKITLVGKGVCFDTGGLDLKPESAMLLMKKDMGGAANVLALAQLIMTAKLPVRLRVLIPAVENSVAGNAFRPLDIYPSRKGLMVEIGNTDAEGRLVLADALALADEDDPDLLIDLGTLTGAARVALGPDLPPFYTNDDALAQNLIHHAQAENDPLWRMPLWQPYDAGLDSKVADVNNIASGGFAGSIICALFLKRFIRPQTKWLHVDIYGWTPAAKPARPEGGECQAARAIFAMLKERYA